MLKIGFAPKTIELSRGLYLHFWYANNRGRGNNNVTIIKTTDTRTPLSREQKNILAKTTTSGWRGNVNFSHRVQSELGII